MDSPTATATATRPRCFSVRFEDTCVLIPPPCLPAKSGIIRPRLVTKSYSLPLWKTAPSKKSIPALQNILTLPDHDPACADAEKEKAEKKAFSLTLSVPISLTTKSRPRRPSLPPQSPCLSKRVSSPPTSPTSSSSPATPAPIPPPPALQRAPTVPQIQPSNLKEADTVPLRPCCETCYPCVDAALAEGEHWAEKWSKGAVRRYSEGEHVHLHNGRPHPAVFGVTRVWTPQRPGGCEELDLGLDVGLAEALQVDEVEVKRRSGEFSHGVLNNRPVPPSADEDALADSDDDELCQDVANPSMLAPRGRPAVLQEEDADLLFPLPSPRRSPNTTPCPTPPSGSQVNLVGTPSQTDLSSTVAGQAREDSKAHVPAEMSSPASALAVTSTPATNSIPAANAQISAPTSYFPVQATIPELAPVPELTPEPEPSPEVTRSAPSSPTHTRQRSTSPTAQRTPQPRRPSFTSASGTLFKNSASVLRGVAAGMTGASANVGVVR